MGVGVQQRVRATVRWNAEHELVPRGARLDVEPDGGVDVQVGPEVELGHVLGTEERRVVVDGWLVARVVVVSEQVEEIEVSVERLDIEALCGVLERRGHGHRDQEPLSARLFRLALERLAHFLCT